MSAAKEAKNAFLHGPTECKLPFIGIEPQPFAPKALHNPLAPRDPTQFDQCKKVQ